MRTIITLLAAFLCLPLAAQEKAEKPALRWGISAGLNGFNAHSLDLSKDRGRWGVQIGIKLEKPFSAQPSHWYLDGEAQLLLLRTHRQKHSAYALAGGVIEHYNTDLTRDAYYLHIPIHAGYKWAFSKQCSLFFDAGPYAAVGLFGKTHYASTFNGKEYLKGSSNTFGNKVNRRLEWGVGGKLGVELQKHYQVGVSYDYGIGRIHYNNHDYEQNANFTFFLSYMF